MVNPLIVMSLSKRLTRTLMSSISSDKGGASEWASKLLLGANEEELEKILDINQKDEGLEILKELQENKEVVQKATEFQELCAQLEKVLHKLLEELNSIMNAKKINGNCDIMS